MFRLVENACINQDIEDSRREMLLDFSLVSALLAKLHDEDEDVRRSIINVLPELAEHGKFPGSR